MFDDDISTFKNLGSPPVTISLSRWIRSTMNSNSKFARQVKHYRKAYNRLEEKGFSVTDIKGELKRTGKDKCYKKSLPSATVSAVCKGGHKKAHVIKRTGWIALDIDAKDNTGIKDFADLRDQLSNISYIAFAGLSVSGRGVWALVKVADPFKQAQYFEQLQIDFRNCGIVLDSKKGKNPNDLRFYSLNPEAYIAKDFKIYDRLPPEKPDKKPHRPIRKTKPSLNGNRTQERVEALILKIEARRMDITDGYESNWLNIGFALEDEFGESGRDYFHAISQYYSNYTRRETDRQYTACIEHKGSGVGIATFFYLCKELDITLDGYHDTRRDNSLESKYEEDNPAPYGVNPFTGEVFDERGYPSEWDTVTLDDVQPITQPQLN